MILKLPLQLTSVCVPTYFLPPLYKLVSELGHPSQERLDMPLLPPYLIKGSEWAVKYVVLPPLAALYFPYHFFLKLPINNKMVLQQLIWFSVVFPNLGKYQNCITVSWPELDMQETCVGQNLFNYTHFTTQVCGGGGVGGRTYIWFFCMLDDAQCHHFPLTIIFVMLFIVCQWSPYTSVRSKINPKREDTSGYSKTAVPVLTATSGAQEDNTFSYITSCHLKRGVVLF